MSSKLRLSALLRRRPINVVARACNFIFYSRVARSAGSTGSLSGREFEETHGRAIWLGRGRLDFGNKPTSHDAATEGEDDEASRIPDFHRWHSCRHDDPAEAVLCSRGSDRLVHRIGCQCARFLDQYRQAGLRGCQYRYQAQLVDAGDNAGIQAIADRAIAAMQTKTDPQADYFEHADPRLPKGAIEAGLYVNIKEAGLSNYSKVNPLAIDSDFSLPYRGSQVLLAYDSTKLSAADAPKTWDALVAWIKANPGQFVYNRPTRVVPAAISSAVRSIRPMASIPRPSRSTTIPKPSAMRRSARPGKSSKTSHRRFTTRAPILPATPSPSSCSPRAWSP